MYVNGLCARFPLAPAAQANLLTTEIAKVASGGVPGQYGQKEVEAKTLASNWADFEAKVGGNPTPAQLAGFIQNNIDYLQDMKGTNDGVIKNYEKSIYNSVRSSLTPEQDAQWKQDYPKAFTETQSMGNAPMQPKSTYQVGQTATLKDGSKVVFDSSRGWVPVSATAMGR